MGEISCRSITQKHFIKSDKQMATELKSFAQCFHMRNLVNVHARGGIINKTIHVCF